MVTNTAALAVFLFRETSEWLLLTPKFYYFTGNKACLTLDSQSASQPASQPFSQTETQASQPYRDLCLLKVPISETG
jgi:hypothetical protein